MRLTANETTGEHTCVMLRELQTSGLEIETKLGWLQAFTSGTLLLFICVFPHISSY
jgi:tRNA(Met) C34 N-acetyltransferase TmcA